MSSQPARPSPLNYRRRSRPLALMPASGNSEITPASPRNTTNMTRGSQKTNAPHHYAMQPSSIASTSIQSNELNTLNDFDLSRDFKEMERFLEIMQKLWEGTPIEAICMMRSQQQADDQQSIRKLASRRSYSSQDFLALVDVALRQDSPGLISYACSLPFKPTNINEAWDMANSAEYLSGFTDQTQQTLTAQDYFAALKNNCLTTASAILQCNLIGMGNLVTGVAQTIAMTYFGVYIDVAMNCYQKLNQELNVKLDDSIENAASYNELLKNLNDKKQSILKIQTKLEACLNDQTLLNSEQLAHLLKDLQNIREELSNISLEFKRKNAHSKNAWLPCFKHVATAMIALTSAAILILNHLTGLKVKIAIASIHGICLVLFGAMDMVLKKKLTIQANLKYSRAAIEIQENEFSNGALSEQMKAHIKNLFISKTQQKQSALLRVCEYEISKIMAEWLTVHQTLQRSQEDYRAFQEKFENIKKSVKFSTYKELQRHHQELEQSKKTKQSTLKLKKTEQKQIEGRLQSWLTVFYLLKNKKNQSPQAFAQNIPDDHPIIDCLTSPRRLLFAYIEASLHTTDVFDSELRMSLLNAAGSNLIAGIAEGVEISALNVPHTDLTASDKLANAVFVATRKTSKQLAAPLNKLASAQKNSPIQRFRIAAEKIMKQYIKEQEGQINGASKEIPPFKNMSDQEIIEFLIQKKRLYSFDLGIKNNNIASTSTAPHQNTSNCYFAPNEGLIITPMGVINLNSYHPYINRTTPLNERVMQNAEKTFKHLQGLCQLPIDYSAVCNLRKETLRAFDHLQKTANQAMRGDI